MAENILNRCAYFEWRGDSRVAAFETDGVSHQIVRAQNNYEKTIQNRPVEDMRRPLNDLVASPRVTLAIVNDAVETLKVSGSKFKGPGF